MFDMKGMMGKVNELQAKMKDAQASLGQLNASAEAGAGMVKATVNGNRQLIKLSIEPSLLSAESQEIVQDLVIAATNKALATIEEQIKNHLQKSTEGLLPNIPGMDLGSMFK